MSKMNKICHNELDSVVGNTIDLISWTPFSNVYIEDACFLLRLTNETDSNVFISFDGINQHEYLPAGNVIEINLPPNASAMNNHMPSFKNRTKVYAQGVTAKGGNIYLSGYYHMPH